MARVVVGIQPVREAIKAHGGRCEKVYVAERDNPRLAALARFAGDQSIVIEYVKRDHLDKLSGGVRHQGVVALTPELVVHDLDAAELGDDTLLMVLDGITDPHNFGATVRSVVALGASGIVWGEYKAAPLTPATFRASAGAVEHATLYRVRSLRAAVSALGERGVTTVALDASSDTSLTDVDLRGPVALVVGAEDEGVQKSVRRMCTVRASLPMSGPIDSLNASVAAAVALYEAVRQRQ
jgi:23S rRNA (guanosine2251-2'-O)-methyltransferase